jgi:hypothetical protein
MMKKFELCFEFEGDKDKYLIPELLPKDEPDTNWDESNALNFQYHYNFLPNSIISRFIVRSQRLISKKTYWRTGVMLKYKGNKALVRADLEDNKIFISISGKESTRREFLAVIRNTFDGIHDTIAKIQVKEMVPVPDHPGIFVKYDYLRHLMDMGETEIIPEGLDKRVSIKALIEGVEPPESTELKAKRYDDRYWEQKRKHPGFDRHYPKELFPIASARPTQTSPANLILTILAFLLAFIVPVLALTIMSNYAKVQHFWFILIGSILVLYAIANYSLLATGILSEKGFLSLMRGFLKSVANLLGKKEE